jgi:hypothetical protein
MLHQIVLATTPDSLRNKQQILLLTLRFNTLNMAPVSGNIVNRNVNTDATIMYSIKNLTMTMQNGVDLQDARSEMNYFLVNARYKLRLSRTLSVSPFMAFYSEHTKELFDPGADANGGMFFTWNNHHLTIEAFALIVRLTHEQSMKEAINRLEVKWKLRSVTLSGFVYHNTRYFDDDERLCLGFRLMLPEFAIFNKVNLRTDVTGSFKIYEHPHTSGLNGVFLSLVMPLKLR